MTRHTDTVCPGFRIYAPANPSMLFHPTGEYARTRAYIYIIYGQYLYIIHTSFFHYNDSPPSIQVETQNFASHKQGCVYGYCVVVNGGGDGQDGRRKILRLYCQMMEG